MRSESLDELDDNELVRLYRATGSSSYIGELFKRYKHLVFGVCYKYLHDAGGAEDAVMEIFEKLHLDLRSVTVLQFKGWLYTVARNYCLMKMRKVSLPVAYSETLPEPLEYDDGEEMEDKILKEALLQKMEWGLESLKPEQKRCLELFYLEDKSYKQIHSETGFGLNEIKTHLQNGKLNLKKKLEQGRGTKDEGRYTL